MEILLGVGFIGVIVAIVLFSLHLEKKRTQAMEAVASAMGFTFSVEAPPALQSATDLFKLFGKGHSRKIRNVLQQKHDGLTVSIFDYRYIVGRGKHSTTYNQTVTLFETNRLDLPVLIMGPESVFHKLGDLFGAHDIDFPEFPEFSKRYLLKGEDEGAIRRVFTEEILRHFDVNHGYSLEGCAGSLLLYRQSARIRPEELERTTRERAEILALFLKSGAARG